LPRWLLALGGGVVWGLCFGEQAWRIAPWFALVPLILALGQPRPALLGWLHGLAFWVTSIPWIVPTLGIHGQLSQWMSVLGLLVLAAYLALFTGLFAAVGAGLWRPWVVTEWLRGHTFSGFPWNLAAYAWIDLPGALPLTAWIGPYGVGFLLLVANTTIADGIRSKRWRVAIASLGGVALLLTWAAVTSPRREIGDQPGLEVRILQPDIGILTEWDPVTVESQYQQIFEMSRQACDRPGSLVIWPESGAWPYSYSRDQRLRQDLHELASMGCPILMNTSIEAEGGVFNSVLLIDEAGLQGRYDKRHLVPYGEYVPMADWLPFLDKIARNAGEYLKGEEGVLLEKNGQSLAAAICFEITFPAEVAGQVRRGGTILMTVTNDSWYGDSSAPWQHYRAARFRAAENRRFLLRAAITGVSAIVGPDGSVQQQLGVGEQGVLAGSIPGMSALTLYTRAPWVVPGLSLVIMAFAILQARRGLKI
jgi:apolipoprotein N-acyltransferase